MKQLRCRLLPALFTLGVLNAASPAGAQTAAQTAAPALPKLWTGVLTVTSVGAPAKVHPRHGANVGAKKTAKDFNTWVDTAFRLEIVRQVGRHLEMRYTTSWASQPGVGTLSADGKMLVFKSPQQASLFQIDGNRLQGCGTANGNTGTMAHWLGNYAAACVEAQASN